MRGAMQPRIGMEGQNEFIHVHAYTILILDALQTGSQLSMPFKQGAKTAPLHVGQTARKVRYHTHTDTWKRGPTELAPNLASVSVW